jgi:copper transport protein
MGSDGAASRRRYAAAVLLAILVAGLGLATARPAAANAFLVAATPPDGSVLTTAPHEVQLTFSEPVEVAGPGVAVVGPDGARVDPGVVRRPRPEVITVRLPGLQVSSRQGTYTVRWRVVSADSRPVGGTYRFSIGAATTARVPAAHADRVVGAVNGVAGFAALAGLMALAGGVALVMYGGPWPGATPGLRRFVVTGWMVLLAATLVALIARGAYAAGTGFGRADVVGQVLHTRYGRALAVRVLLLGAVPALLVWGMRRLPEVTGRDRRRLAVAALIAGVSLALTWTAADHPATSAAAAVGVLHVLAAAIWLGGLAAVVVALRGDPASAPACDAEPPEPAPGGAADGREPAADAGGPAAAPVGGTGRPEAAPGGVITAAKTATAAGPATLVGRFTQVTAACVAVLVVTGGYQAWQRVGGPAELVTTTYGRLLTFKIVLAGGVLAAAVRLRAHLRRGGRPARIVAVGAVAAVAVLALTTALQQVQPAADAQATKPTTESVRFGGGTLEVRLPGTVRGLHSADLTVSPREAAPVQAAWTQTALGVGPLPVRFIPTGAGRYRLDWPPLPVGGGWRLAVTMRTPGGRQATARLSVRIR